MSPWNIAFSNSSKSHFSLVKSLKMCSQWLATTWNIPLSTSLKSYFRLAKRSKWFQSATGALEKSFYPLHPSQILWIFKRQKMTFKCHSTTWIVGLSTWKKSHFQLVKMQKISSKFLSINNRFIDLTQIPFWACQEAKMSSQCLATTLNIAFLNSHMPNFVMFKRQKMSSQCLATTWNIAFSTSPKSYFVMIKRPKMSSKWHESIWNTDFPNSLSRILGWSRGRKCVQVPGKHLKHRFLVLNKVAIWAGLEGRKWAQTAMGALETSPIDFFQGAFLAGQEVENEYKIPFDLQKRRFLTLPLSHFRLVQKPKKSWKCP